ncbi:MAG: DUF3857 domain-containing protein [Deltaproteobacteria bacterium]|nr:DUF3857 domain-containing protein [Deltaproteobacteria bacterium]
MRSTNREITNGKSTGRTIPAVQNASRWTSLLGLVFLTSGICTISATAVASESAFGNKTEEELLRWSAQEARPSATRSPVEVLIDDVRYTFRKDGSHQSIYRRVFVVHDPKAASPLRQVAAPYAPWFEKAPQIRARVIRPDGSVQHLLAADIRDVGGLSEEGSLITDRRQRAAQLPRFIHGAVVEVETLLDEWRPYFREGTVQKALLSRSLPTRRVRLEIDVPQSIPFQASLRGMSMQAEVKKDDGRISRIYDVKNPPQPEDVEEMAPPFLPRTAFVAFSTGKSWQHIATSYGSFVDAAIGENGTKAVRVLVDGLPSLANEKDERHRQRVVETLLLRLRQKVHYTGMELGQAAVLPHDVLRILEKGEGDCKDQSTVLVSSLRALGLDAHVALLRTAPDPEVPPHLPGIGLFNHAIVHVGGTDGLDALWIDPTHIYSGVLDIPANLQGRRALVTSSKSNRLVTIPRLTAKENRYVEIREIRLQDQAPAHVVETTRAEGTIAHALRQFFSKRDDEAVHSNFTSYMERTYGAKSLEHFAQPLVSAFDEPFWLRLEANTSSRFQTDEVEGSFWLEPSMSWGFLPSFLSKDPLAQRQHPLWLLEPHHGEVAVRLFLPPGYRFDSIPASEKVQLSDAYFSREVRQLAPDLLEIRFVVHTGEGRFSAGRANAFVRELGAFQKRSQFRVHYVHDAALALKNGNSKKGLAQLHKLIQKNPTHAPHHERLARALLDLGLGSAAKASARQAVNVAPQRARAHALLGWTLLHDDLGRLLHVGMRREQAKQALLRAEQLAPKHPGTHAQLGMLYLHGSLGGQMGSDAELDQAVFHLMYFRDVTKDFTFDAHIVRALFRLKRFDEAKSLLTSSGANPSNHALLVALIAAVRGPSFAIDFAQNLVTNDDQRSTLLRSAAKELPAIQLYGESTALLRSAVVHLKDGSEKEKLHEQIMRLARIQRATRCFHDDNDPRSKVEKRIYALLSKQRLIQARQRRQSGTLLGVKAENAPERALRFLAFADEEGLPLNLIRDTSVCQASFSARTFAEHQGAASSMELTQLQPIEPVLGSREPWWILRDGNETQVLHPGKETDGFVVEAALEALDAGRLDRAAFWLQDVPLPPQGVVQERRLRLRLGALWLLQLTSGNTKHYVIPDEGKQWLAQSAKPFTGKTPVLLVAAVEKDLPVTAGHFRSRTDELLTHGEFDEVERLAQRRLGEHLGDEAAMEQLAQTSLRRGNIAAGQALLQRLSKRNKKEPAHLNALAWNRLFLKNDGGLDDAIGHSLMANALSDFSSAEHLLTLATLFAESGRNKEALEVLAKSVDARNRGHLSAKEQYVVGRVAERLGLDDVAKTAYQKVQKPVELPELSAWTLAQDRLNALRNCVDCER